MMKLIAAMLAMEFNVVLTATYPYILCGERTDFSGWQKLRLIVLVLTELTLAIIAPVVGYMTKSPQMIGLGFLDSALVLGCLFLYFRHLKDRQRKAACTVDVDGIRNLFWDGEFAKWTKQTGFIEPHRLPAVLAATNHEYPSPEALVKIIEAHGGYAITLDDPADDALKENFNRLKDDLTDPMHPWTGGTVNWITTGKTRVRPYTFFAFTDKNDATVFRLTYT